MKNSTLLYEKTHETKQMIAYTEIILTSKNQISNLHINYVSRS